MTTETTAPARPRPQAPVLDELLIAVDERCAVGCGFCLRADVGREAIDLPTYARALSRGRELGARAVCLTGGEPTDHPDFREMVRVAVQFGLACSVVTAARTGPRLDALAAAAGLLSHVTVSADSLGAMRLGGTDRTIGGTAEVFAALGHGRASLHVTVWQLEQADLDAMVEVTGRFGVPLELSPVLHTEHQLRKASARSVREAYVRDLELLRSVVGLSERFTAAVSDVDASLAGELHTTCTSRRGYVSPRGTLRMCPYDKDDEVDVRLPRAEVAAGVAALWRHPAPVGSRCAMLCGER